MSDFWKKTEKVKYLSKLIPAAAVIVAAGFSGTGEEIAKAKEAITETSVSEIVDSETLLSMIDLEQETIIEQEEKKTTATKKQKNKSLKTGKHKPVSQDKKPVQPSIGTTYTPTIDIPEAGYRDGVYHGSGTGFGGTISVEVVITDHKISNIVILSAVNETPSYFESAKRVISSIISSQNPNVDAISGATYSSNGIIQAVQRALAQAGGNETEMVQPTVTITPVPTLKPQKKPDKKPTPKPTPIINEEFSEDVEMEEVEYYKDGTYTGTAEGFQSMIKVTVNIKDEVIEALNAEHDDTPVFFNKAWTVLEEQLLDKNSIDGIDTVSGATFSSLGILNAVDEALQKAFTIELRPKPTVTITPTQTPTPHPTITPTPTPEITEAPELTPTPEVTEAPEETPTPEITEIPEVTPTLVPSKYKDGTFTGKAYGYNGVVTVKVIIMQDVITDIQVTHSDTPEFFDMAWEILIPQIMANQGVDGIDTVSGATYSSEGILDAVFLALEKAKIKS